MERFKKYSKLSLFLSYISKCPIMSFYIVILAYKLYFYQSLLIHKLVYQLPTSLLVTS